MLQLVRPKAHLHCFESIPDHHANHLLRFLGITHVLNPVEGFLLNVLNNAHHVYILILCVIVLMFPVVVLLRILIGNGLFVESMQFIIFFPQLDVRTALDLDYL